ncbi:hypothetical protein SAMN06297251_10110 [Fulvimarina manganoxydans]|uniref:Uncharacterized protein n=1 Tax=Fulvimarina manganoxydans TaxID=937218 RepID=A0A1W1Y961_9HYPH|nr:hypothetical protein [Fulvimarina manganoxydans]SMC32278.1 hypothetical protein SAMN06297251_10110 [Fulvimarina manganoxydans]
MKITHNAGARGRRQDAFTMACEEIAVDPVDAAAALTELFAALTEPGRRALLHLVVEGLPTRVDEVVGNDVSASLLQIYDRRMEARDADRDS